MLFIDGAQKGVEYKNVNYWIQDYESAFELLTQLTADCWTLEYAIIVDNGDCMSLPVEAFDGQPVQTHIHALEQEWIQLLSAKPRTLKKVGKCWWEDWLLQLDTYYEKLLGHLEKKISILEVKQLKLATQRDSELKLLMSRSYETSLELNKRMYDQITTDRNKKHQLLKKWRKEYDF